MATIEVTAVKMFNVHLSESEIRALLYLLENGVTPIKGSTEVHKVWRDNISSLTDTFVNAIARKI